MENDCQLVDKCDVEVALGVFYHFCSFSHSDTFRLVGACGDDAGIKLIHLFGDLWGGTRRHLANISQAVGLVAWVDPFGGIPCKEVLVEDQTRDALQHWNTVFFGSTRIYSRFVDHDITVLQNLAEGF
jgi:hypothetical protein